MNILGQRGDIVKYPGAGEEEKRPARFFLPTLGAVISLVVGTSLLWLAFKCFFFRTMHGGYLVNYDYPIFIPLTAFVIFFVTGFLMALINPYRQPQFITAVDFLLGVAFVLLLITSSIGGNPMFGLGLVAVIAGALLAWALTLLLVKHVTEHPRSLLANGWLWVSVAVLLALWPLFSGTFAYAPAIEGQVVDAQTGAPIPNARVRAVWHGDRGDTPNIQDISVATADGNGRFTITSFWKRLDMPVSDQVENRDVVVLAHGHEMREPAPWRPAEATVRLSPITSDHEFFRHLRQAKILLEMDGDVLPRWPGIARDDERWLADEWRTFFLTYRNGPVTDELKRTLAADDVAVEMADAAEAVVRETPNSEEARSAQVWLEALGSL